jgi:hypothetical protein
MEGLQAEWPLEWNPHSPVIIVTGGETDIASSPESTPAFDGGNTLLLTHTDRRQPNVADVMLEDDRLIEVSPAGGIAWEWVASDHIDELGFAADARKAIKLPARCSGIH